MFNTILRRLALGVVAGLLAGSALAAWPDRPITLIVPFAPGGSSDLVARAMSQKLGEKLGQSVIVDNRPGATGALGAAALARAKPDGYTFMLASIGTYALNPALNPALQYDPLRDFTLLTEAVRTPNVLVAHPSVAPATVAQLTDYLRSRPGKTSFASGGAGSSEHLNAVLFWQQTGTTGIHVPYKGTGPAVADVLAGHSEVGFLNLSAVSQQVRAGKMKALAVTSASPVPQLPGVPTMGQAGFTGLDVYSWQGIAAPKGLPEDIATKVHAAMVETLRDPAVAKSLSDNGFEVVGSSRPDFQKFVESELKRWKGVVAKAGTLALE